jgi:hypothetical protein
VTCPRCGTVFGVDAIGNTRILKKPQPASSRPPLTVPAGLASRRAAIRPTAAIAAPLARARADEIEILPEKPASRSAVCARHPETRAYETCTRCGDFVCAGCRKWQRGGVTCPDCSARGRPGSGAGPSVPLTVGSVIETAFKATWGTGWKGLVMALIPTVAQVVVGVVVLAFVARARSVGPIAGIVLAAVLFLGVVYSLSQGGLFALIRAALAGEPHPDFGQALGHGAERVAGLCLTQLVAALALFGAMLLPAFFAFVIHSTPLVVIGMLAAVGFIVHCGIGWTVFVPVVLGEGVYGSAALTRSSELVAGNRGLVFLTLFAGGLLIFVLGIPVALVHAMLPATLGMIVQAVAGAVSFALSTSLLTTLYFALKGDERA